MPKIRKGGTEMINHYCDICNQLIPHAKEGWYLTIENAFEVETLNPMQRRTAKSILVCSNCYAMIALATTKETPVTKLQLVLTDGVVSAMIDQQDIKLTQNLSIIMTSEKIQEAYKKLKQAKKEFNAKENTATNTAI